MSSRTDQIRPMRGLIQRLPQLALTSNGEVEFAANEPALLGAIAEDAEMLMRAMHLGVGAIGQLLANSAVVIEDGTISADCLEALGFLMSELGDMAAACMVLAGQCRRETADHKPAASGSTTLTTSRCLTNSSFKLTLPKVARLFTAANSK